MLDLNKEDQTINLFMQTLNSLFRTYIFIPGLFYENMKSKTIKLIEHLGKDRHYIDVWSLGHIVFGIVVGIILGLFSWSLLTTSFAALFVFAFWEIIEPRIFEHIIKKKFNESLRNQLMDLVYGLIGFLVYWQIF